MRISDWSSDVCSSDLCTDPTEEDREWFPDIAGSKEPMEVLKHIWANYRDESFIAQFLSPHLIRNWRLFHLVDDEDEPALRVDAIHNERGYRKVRRALARQYDIGWQGPDIQVDRKSTRRTSSH